MLEPKKVKFRRHHRGNRKGMASRGSHVAFGSYGLKATEAGWITARQIESARITISRVVRKTGKMWIRIFPDKPITKKPAETRMGKGKGPPEYWVAVVGCTNSWHPKALHRYTKPRPPTFNLHKAPLEHNGHDCLALSSKKWSVIRTRTIW